MINFLLAEQYRVRHHRALWLSFGVTAFVILLSALQTRFLLEDSHDISLFVSVLESLLTFGIYVFVTVNISSFSRDRLSLMQLNAQGHSRPMILIGQFLASIGIAFVFTFIVFAASLVFGLLLFEPVNMTNAQFALSLTMDMVVFFLLMIPLQAIALSLQYLFLNPALSIPLFFGIVFFIPSMYDMGQPMNNMIQFLFSISQYSLMFDFQMRELNGSYLLLSIVLHTLVWLGIALLRFRKYEF